MAAIQIAPFRITSASAKRLLAKDDSALRSSGTFRTFLKDNPDLLNTAVKRFKAQLKKQ